MSESTNGLQVGQPSKWKDEGDKTLKPSSKMVGKVWEALNE